MHPRHQTTEAIGWTPHGHKQQTDVHEHRHGERHIIPLRETHSIHIGHALRSTDQGRSWADVPTGTEQSWSGGRQFADGTIVLVGLGGTVGRSTDAGQSFQTTIRPERQTLSAVDEGAPGQSVIVGLGGIADTQPAAR